MSRPQTGATHYYAQLVHQTKVVQSKGWLSAIVCCNMAKINGQWDGSTNKRKVRGLVPCCGQDGYRTQVPQLPIDSYTHLTRASNR